MDITEYVPNPNFGSRCWSPSCIPINTREQSTNSGSPLPDHVTRLQPITSFRGRNGIKRGKLAKYPSVSWKTVPFRHEMCKTQWTAQRCRLIRVTWSFSRHSLFATCLVFEIEESELSLLINIHWRVDSVCEMSTKRSSVNRQNLSR
jgi:hypothetical protein